MHILTNKFTTVGYPLFITNSTKATWLPTHSKSQNVDRYPTDIDYSRY